MSENRQEESLLSGLCPGPLLRREDKSAGECRRKLVSEEFGAFLVLIFGC